MILHLFRRDLRLSDNSALNKALARDEPVIPAFILEPALLAKWQRATRRLAFLAQSLVQLSDALGERGSRLLVQVGDPAEALGRLVSEHGISEVFANRDYTPFSQRRDQALAQVCRARGASFQLIDDLALHAPGQILKADGQPYMVFTPYHRRALDFQVAPPSPMASGRLAQCDAEDLQQLSELQPLLGMDPASFEPGIAGANRALKRVGRLADYSSQRDLPDAGMTSGLSAHLRFGTCSARQVHAAVAASLGPDHPLIRQLHWRDFYIQIAWHFPHVFGHAFRRQYDDLPWREDERKFRLWQEGRTGFPIVDAGMRELLQTGYMHNRLRMVVASFLTKNLHISWQRGEAHFAEQLVDYEPAVNNGNWQWSASTGCDAQPWFRVFNPWRQQKKFDPDCGYIKRWVPELGSRSPSDIHGLENRGDFYLPQLVDLKSSSEEIKQMFRDTVIMSGVN